MTIPPRPTRDGPTLDATKASDGSYDAEAWAVMDRRDNSLIETEILHGAGSSKFVYSFTIAGSGTVAGISVIGARHLAAHYGSMAHKLIGSMQKTGALLTFTSYPQPGVPMNVSCSVVRELQDEDDFYAAIVEVRDTKTNNVIQVERRESQTETKRDGTTYKRPHYATIAQAKAYRNAILALIPQDIQVAWKEQMLTLGKNDIITSSVIDEKRSAVLRFATSRGVNLNRLAVDGLTMDQIAGLSDAARIGVPEFKLAAAGAGILRNESFLAVQNSAPMQPETAGGGAANGRASAEPSPQQQVQQQAQQREPDAKPQPEQKPKEQIKQQEQPKPGTAAEVAATVVQNASVTTHSAFTEYLADETGEMVTHEGEPRVFRSPIEFANALAEVAKTCGNLAGLFENNEIGIEAAGAISDEARSIIDAIFEATPLAASSAPTSAPAPIAIPKKGDRQDFVGYHRAVHEALKPIADEPALAAWEKVNEGVIAALPAIAKRQVQGEISNKRAMWAPKADTSQPTATATASAPDADAELTTHLLGEIAACATWDDIVWWSKKTIPATVVARLKRERPDQFQRIQDAVNARQPAAEG